MLRLFFHTQEGATALHIVAHFNKPQRAEMLIKAGAHVTALDGQQRTPLMRAREAGNQECEALLLEAETAAEVKAKESIEAQKALVIAVKRANEESTRLKLMKAADVAEAEEALSPGEGLATSLLAEFPEQMPQLIWEQLSEVSDELKEQIKCHLPAAQGTPALQQALNMAAVLKIIMGGARRDLAEAMLQSHIAASTAAKRYSEDVLEADPLATSEDSAAREFARGRLDEELAGLKTALAEHSEAAESSDVLREARALRDTMVEESRRAREEVRTHSAGVGLEEPQPHTAASWGCP